MTGPISELTLTLGAENNKSANEGNALPPNSLTLKFILGLVEIIP